MAKPCYSGPLPVTDDERTAIWSWAKENAIDHGLPFAKVGDMINEQFFAGQAKPEWITDLLSGRKTPFREVANDAWRKQYNRRVITQQAKDISRTQALGPVGKMVGTLWTAPRAILTFGHGAVFPVIHGGDLALRPASWGTFFRGVFNTWSKSWTPGASERLLDTMKRQPLYDTALRSGLDVGEKSHPIGILSSTKGPSARAWDILTTMRYELWDHEMQKWIKPDMAQAQVLDIGQNLAEWANHATGSAKGPIASLGGNVLFGPKLTQSKLSRLITDPAKTIQTFTNWQNASAGEKAAAWTRLSGAAQYLGTGLGLLAVNQGMLWATGQKQQINVTDPTKSDWLAFKGGGVEWNIPGLHSEIRTVGKILAGSLISQADVMKASFGRGRGAFVGDVLKQYAMGKLAPTISAGLEAATGETAIGEQLPWSRKPLVSKKGVVDKRRLDWAQYAISHGPIPLSGPTRFVYDKLKEGGMSALDASALIKGSILSGLDITGMHAREEPPPKIQTRQQIQQAARRQQVANQLRGGR